MDHHDCIERVAIGGRSLLCIGLTCFRWISGGDEDLWLSSLMDFVMMVRPSLSLEYWRLEVVRKKKCAQKRKLSYAIKVFMINKSENDQTTRRFLSFWSYCRFHATFDPLTGSLT